MTRKTVEFIHEGKYAVEVPVDLIEDDTGWSPYFSLEDARKLDAARLALRAGAPPLPQVRSYSASINQQLQA